MEQTIGIIGIIITMIIFWIFIFLSKMHNSISEIGHKIGYSKFFNELLSDTALTERIEKTIKGKIRALEKYLEIEYVDTNEYRKIPKLK